MMDSVCQINRILNSEFQWMVEYLSYTDALTEGEMCQTANPGLVLSLFSLAHLWAC